MTEGWPVPVIPDERVSAVLRDARRLREVAELDLCSPAVDRVLADLAAEAAARFALSVGVVSALLADRQYFVAMHGIGGDIEAARGVPIAQAICRFVVCTRQPLVIEDAMASPLAKGNALVRADGIRSYLGVPLVTARGEAVGSFCVIGAEPREFSGADVSSMCEYAGRAMGRIESRRTRRAA